MYENKESELPVTAKTGEGNLDVAAFMKIRPDLKMSRKEIFLFFLGFILKASKETLKTLEKKKN